MTPDNSAPDNIGSPIINPIAPNGEPLFHRVAATTLPDGTRVETAEPTPEEIEAMIESFGNLPPEEYARPMKPATPDPLQGFDIDFDGFKHKPLAYTLNIGDNTLWISRGMFFEDVKYIPEGRLPIPSSIFVNVSGDPVPSPEGPIRETVTLRIDFVKDENNDAWADIDHIDAKNATSAVPSLELVLHIESITTVDGVVVEKESDRG
jgi:hypothetical protein